MRTGCEDEASLELVTEEIAQQAQADDVFGGSLPPGLDLKPDRLSVVSLDDAVDLFVVVGVPVGNRSNIVVPGCLLE